MSCATPSPLTLGLTRFKPELAWHRMGELLRSNQRRAAEHAVAGDSGFALRPSA